METDGDSTTTQPVPVHLNDLQSYLVTFNKEIEPGEQDTFTVGGASDADGKPTPVYVTQLAVQVDEQQTSTPDLVDEFVKPSTPESEVVGNIP